MSLIEGLLTSPYAPSSPASSQHSLSQKHLA
jgi:hypothetical protein